LSAEAFVHVIVERAHHGVGQAIRGISEDSDQLHQRITGHPQFQCFDKLMQSGDVRFSSGADVVPVENLGQFIDYRVVET
jgi:hypothetical protein